MARLYSALSIVGNRVAANTDDCYIEINVPINVTIRVKRVHIDDNSGQGAALADLPMRVRFYRTTTTMADGTAFTPIKRNPMTANSSCTVKTKTASTTTATPGTIADIFDRFSLRSEHYFDWSARDALDAMTVVGPGFWELVLSTSSTTARTRNIHVLWEEF